MKAIVPFAEIMDIDIGVDVLKKIEWVGRTCYKSTENIKEGSAEKFVSNLIKSGHEAMLEHGSFCFRLPHQEWGGLQTMVKNLEHHNGFKGFLRFTADGGRCLVSGNVRAWRDFMKAYHGTMDVLPTYFRRFIEDNPVLFPEYQRGINYFGHKDVNLIPIHTDDLKTENEFLTHCDVTVRFIVDRGISHELVRHRPASFAQESTRYCNYSKGKFDGQITFIIPYEFKYGSPEWNVWKDSMERAELDYLRLIDLGVTPQWARGVLGNSLKTEVVMTATCGEWKHFFGLRACNNTGKAHPQMVEVTRPLLDDFKKTISVVFDDLAYGE